LLYFIVPYLNLIESYLFVLFWYRFLYLNLIGFLYCFLFLILYCSIIESYLFVLFCNWFLFVHPVLFQYLN
ncbi:hypothetical protein L9F63_011502, partial [Diploptera punctata]